MKYKHLTAIVLAAGAIGINAVQAKTPNVVASIAPVHALVTSVMEGVSEPALLVRPGASPHHYALKPSDVRSLNNADVVFWLGPDLETFLEGPLKALGADARVVALNALPGVHLLESRQGGTWEKHQHHHDGEAEAHEHENEHEHEAEHHHDDGHHHDPHTWLNPANALLWTDAVADVLSTADPANAERYRANAQATLERLGGLDAELSATLSSVRNTPFIVFHDAYQYFENRYGLTAVGSVAVDPERKPGAKRVLELKTMLRNLKAECIFSEPQFPPKIVDTLIEDTDTRRGVLDPIGSQTGVGSYETLIRNLAANVKDCLSR